MHEYGVHFVPVPGNEIRCAKTWREVEAAWRLVYDAYLARGIIEQNPQQIHTAPCASGTHTCVIYRSTRGEIVSTMTTIRDSSWGLPLDQPMGDRLDALRLAGRRLVEVGMLADRRIAPGRSVRTLFELMRWAVHFALHEQADDIVIGVHPRHVGFYVRAFGMEIISPTRQYEGLRQSPVVLLRCALDEWIGGRAHLPRGLAFAMQHPIPLEAFAHRYRFAPATPDACHAAETPRARCASSVAEWSTTGGTLMAGHRVSSA